jgi:hypothetical protein
MALPGERGELRNSITERSQTRYETSLSYKDATMLGSYLSVHLRKPSIGLNISGQSHAGWRLSFRAKMGWTDEFDLSNGRNLGELEGHLVLNSRDEEPQKCIGSLRYFRASRGEKATYQIEVLIPERQFGALLDLTQRGIGPLRASISLPTLEIGQPWDFKKDEWLAIDSITFAFTNDVGDNEVEASTEVIPEPEPSGPSAEVLAIREMTAKLQRWVTWILGVVLLVAILLLARGR